VVSYGIAVDATTVYRADAGRGKIVCCAIAGCGGQPTAIATLQSSPMGHRIYQRLTFRDVFDYQIFVRRPSRPDATLPPDPSLQPDPSLPRDQPAD
jgi:hypothetical protein